MTDVKVTTTEAAITGETVVRSITVFTFSGTVTPAGGDGAVTSVNSQTGDVVLTASDVGALPDSTAIPNSPDDIGAATAAQGGLADTAVQPGDLAAVATSGDYADLTGAPTLGTAAAADTGDFDAAGAAAAAQTASEAYTDAAVAGVGGAVDSVNSQTGTVVLDASDVGADPSGSASTAQTAAEGYTDSAIASEVARADAVYATAAQGATADSAVQPGDLSTVATTGAYPDLTGKPTIPSTAADVGAVPTTRTVAGHALSADVTLVKSDVGLGNVDNTADSAKTFTESQVTGLTADLAAKLVKASNLSDLANAGTARTNLGLGTAATVDTGTSSGNIPLLSTGGRLAIARIASGTPDGTKFVRDDGTLSTPSGGGASGFTQLRKSADQSIANNTWTAVTWDIEDQDTLAGHGATNPSRFTAPVDGVYSVYAGVSIGTSSTGLRYMSYYINGTQIEGWQQAAGQTNNVMSLGGRPFALSAGDYIELFVWQNSGGSLSLLHGPVAGAGAVAGACIMTVVRVGSL